MMTSIGDGLPLLVILDLLRIELLFGERKDFVGDDFSVAGGCLYTSLKNIKTFWGYQTFLALDVD